MFIFLGTRRVCFTKKARESSKFHRQGFANGNMQPKREVRRGKTIAETKRGECLANILLFCLSEIAYIPAFSTLFIFFSNNRQLFSSFSHFFRIDFDSSNSGFHRRFCNSSSDRWGNAWIKRAWNHIIFM